MSAESALIDSAGGDFEKVVIAVMLLSHIFSARLSCIS
jgi:hypothetical protein